MTGSHSLGEAASHPLVTIRKAYNEALEVAAQEDPIVSRRSALLKEKITAADEALVEILDNLEAVEAEIRRIADTAIAQAKSLAGEKSLIVRSTRTELIRKQAELEAIGTLLVQHKKGSGPLTFLRAFDREVALISTLQGTGDLPADVKIRGDLTVFGGVDVKIGSEVGKAAAQREQDLLESGLASPISRKRPKDEGGDIEWSSIATLAQRREQRNKARGIELDFQPFQGSEILSSPEEATKLYRCFPFKAVPQTHLLFSSTTNSRSIRKMHEIIDGIGITAVLIKRGTDIFGGFAAAKWRNDGVPFGEGSSSFLFTLAKDAIIPYRPQATDPVTLYATEDTLTFGKEDLVLAEDFDNCSSSLEHAFGLGFDIESTESLTFLAGEPAFKADLVEVWGFFTIEQDKKPE
jgi:hypothetical protein